MPSLVIEAQHLTKWYGPRLAVRDVSFRVEAGEVVGLLGPNGSGKSTIFRILTGYLTPSSGSAVVAGHDVAADSLALRRDVGYVPEDAPLYGHMRVREFLKFMAQLKGLSGQSVGEAIERVTARLQLSGVLKFPIGKLSRGYRQRVALAQALLTEPKVLVLDEPTSGLDPNQVIAVRDLISDLASKQTVLIASHVLSEIEQIASRVMILLDGKLLTTDALGGHARPRQLRLQVYGPEAEVRQCLLRVPAVLSIDSVAGRGDGPGRYVLQAEPQARLGSELATAIIAHGFALGELTELPANLEHIFRELTRGGAQAAA